MIRPAILLLSLFLCGAASAQSSVVSIQQAGVLNTAEAQVIVSSLVLAQSGDQNETYIQQVGEGGHVIRLSQSGGSLAEIVQDGTDHQLVGPAGGDAVQKDASTLLLAQSGFNNSLVLVQSGGAYTNLTQIGTGNTVTATQAFTHSP